MKYINLSVTREYISKKGVYKITFPVFIKVIFISAGIFFMLLSIILFATNNYAIPYAEKILGVKSSDENIFNESSYVLLVLVYSTAIFSFFISICFLTIAWLCHRSIKKSEYVNELEELNEAFYTHSH